MARVFIHVGPHKTGTTFLQDVILSNRESLRGQGICIPVSGSLNQALPHHNLVWDIASSKANYKPEFGGIEALCEEIKDEKHVVISSENFASFPHCFFKIVNKLVSHGHEVFSIYALRDQLSIINSAYTQRIKTFNLNSKFDEYFETALLEKRYDQLEFYKDLWATKCSNKFIVYSRKNLLKDFLDAAEMSNVRLLPTSKSGQVNVSPNDYEIEILRVCSPILKNFGKDFVTTLIMLRQTFEKHGIDNASSFWGPSTEQTRAAREIFNAPNRKLCVRLNIDEASLQFRKKERSLIEIDKLSPAKKAEMSKILKDFLKVALK